MPEESDVPHVDVRKGKPRNTNEFLVPDLIVGSTNLTKNRCASSIPPFSNSLQNLIIRSFFFLIYIGIFFESISHASFI